ncbi:GNAT family N-acetyltransferase [Bacillus shivajii]|uniref:GNAT family N-acetyltransferase n=1 Tax=Bacillus shivajii TaxID=1983719 RepID=UPI001CFB2465|nr:GNAT family N-acetyltransferase [Bacillus shivajii]UCZ52984.1 GNAT family N-acetyltransferase [Bacillus shivajii]
MQFHSWDELNEEHILAICKLWNREIGEQFPMRESLFKQNSVDDENVCISGSFFVLNDGGQCIGAIVTKICQTEEVKRLLAEEVGWIQWMLVDSAFRNKGIGGELLKKAEAALKDQGAKKVIGGRDPFHYFPGIPVSMPAVRKWFEGKGYKYSKTVSDFIRHEDKEGYDEMPFFPEVSINVLSPKDQNDFLTFMHEKFPGRWEYEAKKYYELGGSGREYIVMKQGGAIIGFCRVNDADSPMIAQNTYWAPRFNGRLGGIGPLGIDKAYRKHGYGLGIVQAAITVLQKREVDHLIIDWTELIEFYQKFGFEIIWRYDQLEKTRL